MNYKKKKRNERKSHQKDLAVKKKSKANAERCIPLSLSLSVCSWLGFILIFSFEFLQNSKLKSTRNKLYIFKRYEG